MGSGTSTRRNPSTGRDPAQPARYSTWVPYNRPRPYFGDDAGRRWAGDSPLADWRVSTPLPVSTRLKVVRVDLKAGTNQLSHFTHEIEGVEGLVVRRGQPVELGLELSRPYDKTTDSIVLNFKTGAGESAAQRTHMMVSLDGSLSSLAGEWKAEVTGEEANSLSVSVTPSAKALVGKYSLSVHTKVTADDSDEPARFMFDVTEPVFLLFNAWCETDQVYLAKPEERGEYVLNERGRIWYGNSRQRGSRPWGFNQFEKTVFEAVMFLLESHVDGPARGNSVMVSRKMSAAVNSQDDNGVLSGRWDGNYQPHTRPTKWTGSQRILEEYFNNKAPVRYGQCWVFSGVLTTVLRCLGIPGRSITNFASAHDTDSSLTIDKYFSVNGDDLYSPDSVWNFHVWNEAWMSRPELPAGYGGWQVVDATPQETSEGLFQTGPCPVNSIKQGHVYYPYDGLFIFAEVNGDRVYWKRNHEGLLEIIKIKKNSVGKYISTKAVGSKDVLDVTNEYKHPEGSDAERAAVKLAAGFGTKPNIYDTPDTSDDVEMSIQLADLCIGADFDIVVPVANKSAEERTVSVSITVQVVYYTGVVAGKLKTEERTLVLGPGEDSPVTFGITADEYLDKLVDQSALKVFLHGHVKETGQALADEEDFRLRTPDIDIVLIQPAAGEIQIGTWVKVELQLANPLVKTLTNCEITVEGPGLLTPTIYKHNNVAPGGTLTQTVDFKPWRAGERTLIATFESDLLSQVTGELDVTVAKH